MPSLETEHSKAQQSGSQATTVESEPEPETKTERKRNEVWPN